jgi:hypothetical protein
LVLAVESWYLIPIVAMLALRHDGIGFAFLLCSSSLGLIYYPLSDWAWPDTGWSASRGHLLQALFLTVPVVVFLAARVVHRHALKRRPTEIRS